MSVFDFWFTHRGELGRLLSQHAVMVIVSTAVAIAIGLPAGIYAARHRRAGRAILAFANIAQTIPSLALLGFLLPLPLIGGVGPRTALVALSLYALLPIVRNTMTGLLGVDRAAIEAGVAMGMTPGQLLRLVELPLALPSIVAGVRVATVIGVGTATIAAAIGAGGLGEYIFRGLSMVDATTILAGAIPAALLALVADGAIAWVERKMRRGVGIGRAMPIGAVMLLLLLAAGAIAYARVGTRAVVVGSKNFTEQVILGELIAQSLEHEGVAVVRKLNLGGTFVCDQGIRAGDLDLYVEYTGTAVSAVFHEEVPREPARAFARARELYAPAGLTVAEPLGFNNTFTILVRAADARQFNLDSIDDLQALASQWLPGFGYEFLQREDGYPGLARTYGLQFARPPRAMELSLIYRALAERQIDLTAGDATSALIDALELAPLADTKHYFPPYDAFPVVRTAAMLREPAIARALGRIAGRITDRDMRALNNAVDVKKRDSREVVREYLLTLGVGR